jgi:hypothetical protein
MRTDPITMPLSVTVDGREWKLFNVDYNTPDGAFSFKIYAISFEHAAAIVEEIKETAKLGGMLDSWVAAT